MSTLNSRAGWTSADSNSKDLHSLGASEQGQGNLRRPADVVQFTTSSATRPEIFVEVESHEMIDSPSSKFPMSDSSTDLESAVPEVKTTNTWGGKRSKKEGM